MKQPYPQPGQSWLVQRKWNDLPMQAMTVTQTAVELFRKNVDDWDKADNQFYTWMHNEQ